MVGFVGSSARHHELGPIALALVKRNVPLDATLTADGLVAAQEVVVDPEVGLHVRPAGDAGPRTALHRSPAPYDAGQSPPNRSRV